MNQQTNEDIWRQEFEALYDERSLVKNQYFPEAYLKIHIQHVWMGYLAARKKAQEEIDRLRTNLDSALLLIRRDDPFERIQSLKDELKAERAAVDFYAKEINWHTEKVNYDQNNPIYKYNLSVGTIDMTVDGIIAYGGKLARETQAKRKEIL